MARSGDVLIDPSMGTRLSFRRTAAQTRGRLTEYRVDYSANAPRPEPQLHLDREHVLEVINGSLVACVSGREHSLAAGDVLLIGKGEAHAVWNPLPHPAVAVWQTVPALDTEAQLEARYTRLSG